MKIIARSGDILGAAVFAFLTIIRSRRPVKVRLGEIDVVVRPCTTDIHVAKESFSGEFDEAIGVISQPGDKFIVDAGGYIGTAAIVLARAFPSAMIISLEPSKDNFYVLQMNAARYPNVVPLNIALGATAGTIPLFNRGSGAWGFSIVENPADSTSPPLHDTEVTTIPDIMRKFDKVKIDLLKLDIEGAEYELFAAPPIWMPSVKVILVELHDSIVPGCEKVFYSASVNRSNTSGTFEKVMSVAPEHAQSS